MCNVITIPFSFQHPLFFSEDVLTIHRETTFNESLKGSPFLYDLLHQLKMDEWEKPWERRDVYISRLFARWNMEKEGIGQCFQKRNRTAALKPMVLSIGHFVSALFWVNGVPVPSLKNLGEDIKALSYKPINAAERIDFLLQQPNQYHSYIQLEQLYGELIKVYHKTLIMTKRTSQ
jgi:hypothetical protein